mgnify:CR=1 FL=1
MENPFLHRARQFSSLTAHILLAAAMLFSAFSGCASNSADFGSANSAARISESGISLSVRAKKDGLHIKKSHPSEFTHVTVHVEGRNGGNFSINTDGIQNSFVYPFVSGGSEYSVYLTMTDAKWQNFTRTEAAKVRAKGGLGEMRTVFSSAEYDSQNSEIIFRDFITESPEGTAARNLNTTFSGNIYYGVENGTDWSRCVWGNYRTETDGRDLRIGLKDKLPFFAGSEFFLQLDMSFVYGGTNFARALIGENDRFRDTHTTKKLTADNGILLPAFNPAVTEYTLTGTENDAILTFAADGETENGSPEPAEETQKILRAVPENSVMFTAEDGTEYKVTFAAPQKRVFDGKEYILTFSDDFEGTELDPSRWRRSAEQERQAQMNGHGWWADECSYVQDGNLVIEAKEKDGRLISGAVETAGIFEQAHGLYEIRFRTEKTSGLWYAFWLLGQNDENHVGNGARDAAEIDIFELVPNEPYGNGPNFFKTTIHWDGHGDAKKSNASPAYNPGDDFYGSWHTVQFLWDDENYFLYLDGELLWELDGEEFGGMCDGTAQVIISSEFGDWGGPTELSLLPAKMYVDYVHIYRRN